MKTIYNTYVVMESQEQCDRMKQLCIDNGLPIWDNKNVWKWIDNDDIFANNLGQEFFILADKICVPKSSQITESEFIELLKTTK